MRIEQIKETFDIEPGAPTPTILSNEYMLYLIFYIRKTRSDREGKSVHVRSNKDEGIVTIQFNRFAQFKFGSPNDEAIDGHPYYPLGLEAYSIQKVTDSDWIEELKKRNAVHPYHKDEHFSRYQHFIFFFHDTCFEIVAENYVVVKDSLSTMQDEIVRIAKLL